MVALFVFYCLEFATALVAWHEAPIRTDALVDPMVAYAVCAGSVLPGFLLPGRWRAVPALLATAAGVLTPILLTRDLMEVIGPRDVWVGQSLTLQVLFPLVLGLCAVVAILSAPRVVPVPLGEAPVPLREVRGAPVGSTVTPTDPDVV